MIGTRLMAPKTVLSMLGTFYSELILVLAPLSWVVGVERLEEGCGSGC